MKTRNRRYKTRRLKRVKKTRKLLKIKKSMKGGAWGGIQVPSIKDVKKIPTMFGGWGCALNV